MHANPAPNEKGSLSVKSSATDVHGLAKDISHGRTCHSNPLVSCGDCRLGELCLPIALDAVEISHLDEIVKRGRALSKGDYLYREGDEFTSIYAIRAGSFKTFKTTMDGVEQVTGLYLPGEIVGMDGISSNRHGSSAMALETGSFCEIPFNQLEELSARIPSLQGRFFRLMGQEIVKDQQMLTLVSSNAAEERVAALLLSISSRNHRRKLSPTQFRLAMTRADIGSYLGVTLETVSRVFSRLQKQSIVKVDNKEIHVIDMAGLKAIAKVSVSGW
jgi:CRP/FNR family transcriptional regulator